jgi:hypothetical protein
MTAIPRSADLLIFHLFEPKSTGHVNAGGAMQNRRLLRSATNQERERRQRPDGGTESLQVKGRAVEKSVAHLTFV